MKKQPGIGYSVKTGRCLRREIKSEDNTIKVLGCSMKDYVSSGLK